MPDYIDALGHFQAPIFTLAVVSGVSAHGQPNLSPHYAPPGDRRGWRAKEAGLTYIAYNQVTAEAEAAQKAFINYISYSGVAIDISSLPQVTQQAFLNPSNYQASIEIREYLYSQYGPVAIVWNSVKNNGNTCALLPSGTWNQIESMPQLNANAGLYLKNPTWVQNISEP